MAINTLYEPLITFGYRQEEQNVDILRGVYTQGFLLRMTGTLDVAGGTTDGTVLSENVARLLTTFRNVWDGLDISPPDMNGRFLAALTNRSFSQPPRVTNVESAAIGSTDFSAEWYFPLARPWLGDPFNTVMPPLPVGKQLRIYVRMETGASNPSSDPGTGAFIAGGDRTVTLSNVRFTITQQYAEKGVAPMFLPIYAVETSRSWGASLSNLEFELNGENRFDSLLLQQTFGANAETADLVNLVSFLSGSKRWLNEMEYEQLKAEDYRKFPAIPVPDKGYLMIPFADGGKLGNAVDPVELHNPRMIFDASAPSSGEAVIRVLQSELVTVPEITRVQAPAS